MGEPKLDLTENMINQPGKEILFAHLASNLLKSGELEMAIKICERGLKKFPTYAQAHYILARCYLRKKLTDEARSELERVLRYDPNHIKSIRDLAGLHFTNGFQDLYREYLMQLFTLDPINENVIQEAKKLGEYKLWSPAADETVPSEPDFDSEQDVIIDQEKENVFVEPEKEKTKELEENPVFPDKIDLSQFDNVEDDFTTILHGKLEYSGKISRSLPKKDPDLADIAKDILEKPGNEDINKSAPEENLSQPQLENSSATEEEVPNQKFDDEGYSKELESTLDKEMSSSESSQESIADASGEHSAAPTTIDDDILKDQKQEDESLMNFDEFPDDEDDKFEQPKIISQTLGEILVSQQKYVEAKSVFEALKEKQPDNKALDLKIEYLNRIIGLEKKGKS